MTINDAIMAYAQEAEATNKQSSAWRTFAKQFSERWGGITVKEALEGPSAARWMADERKGVGTATGKPSAEASILAKIAFLRRLAALSTEAGFPAAFPRRLAESVVVNNERNPQFTPLQRRRLKEEMHKEDWAIVDFFLHCGLRSQEAWNLKVQDIDFSANEMRINRTKTRKPFTVEMHPVVRKMATAAARAHREYVLQPAGLDIGNRLYLAKRWVQVVFKTAVKRAGIPVGGRRGLRGVHCLRHAFCSDLINAGAEPVFVSALVNHTDLKSTMRYVHPHKRAVKKTLALLG